MGRGNYAASSTKALRGPGKKKTSQLLSTQDAADYLGISYTTFRKYRKMGQIPFRKVGDKLYKYETADLDEFARKIDRRDGPKDAA